MTADQELRKIASETARYAQARVTRLEEEVLDLEKRLAEKKTERDSARLAAKRLSNFQVTIGTDYQCPRCWIESGTRSPLRPIGGGTRDEDFFRCRRGHDVTIPIF